jgi:hypothetical protein
MPPARQDAPPEEASPETRAAAAARAARLSGLPRRSGPATPPPREHPVVPELNTQVLQQVADALKHRLFQDVIADPSKLQYLQEIAKTVRNMEVDSQQVIARATEETEPPEAVKHPAPDTITELGGIAAEALHVTDVVNTLRERGVPLTATEAEMAIKGLHAIMAQSQAAAWQLGLHAVERGLITQTQLAEYLEVNKATVSRHYRDDLGATESVK